MSGIRCFLIEPTEQCRVWLRRYVTGACAISAFGPNTHQAKVLHGDVERLPSDDGILRIADDLIADDDPRWPNACGCGFEFSADVDKQVFHRGLYRRADTGEIMTIEDAPPGAIWDATWMHDSAQWCGADGKALMCKCPDGHDWHIDGLASNCTMPDDKVHKCWVRHGTPPDLTVDKGGNTCQAGAGSIQTPSWHGFLRNGYLVVA